ncbi:MAG: tRNA (adenosine(37)-N6)-dimethylallyltransferase MiaA [Deferribacteraceae bacterium]|jgi:tRNA dimethylallyltransferase|nr:tRNA (adenosine(37)-N6)-dimethylallyltransferase MiaA [Deferribacteraceae bacterium]
MNIPVITGATASGKSALIMELAERGVNFEIVSADAFQVYRRLDIGTAKPDREVRDRIRHHLIDIVDADGEYNTGDFVIAAESAIDEILSRGAIPIISGGTGLYIQSLRDGIFEVPPADPIIREKLHERAKKEGSAALYREFKANDPVAAARIHENDLVRIVRGLEVWQSTGMPISQAQKKLQRPPKYRYNVMVINKDRDSLYKDIDERTNAMLKGGWLNEVRSLLDSGLSVELPSFRAIGYRELADVVLNGSSLDVATETIARKTRNYAKRQLTWFRGMDDVKFMEAEAICSELSSL